MATTKQQNKRAWTTWSWRTDPCMPCPGSMLTAPFEIGRRLEAAAQPTPPLNPQGDMANAVEQWRLPQQRHLDAMGIRGIKAREQEPAQQQHPRWRLPSIPGKAINWVFPLIFGFLLWVTVIHRNHCSPSSASSRAPMLEVGMGNTTGDPDIFNTRYIMPQSAIDEIEQVEQGHTLSFAACSNLRQVSSIVDACAPSELSRELSWKKFAKRMIFVLRAMVRCGTPNDLECFTHAIGQGIRLVHDRVASRAEYEKALNRSVVCVKQTREFAIQQGIKVDEVWYGGARWASESKSWTISEDVKMNRSEMLIYRAWEKICSAALWDAPNQVQNISKSLSGTLFEPGQMTIWRQLEDMAPDVGSGKHGARAAVESVDRIRAIRNVITVLLQPSSHLQQPVPDIDEIKPWVDCWYDQLLQGEVACSQLVETDTQAGHA